MWFICLVQKIQIGHPFESDYSRSTISLVNLYYYSLFESMTFLGRASMMAFVFMSASYLVTGQIIPGIA